jgi:Xaa-Pro aminopeptidase
MANRVTALQQRIQSWGCDALLVSNDPDVQYLTGFVAENSWVIVLADSNTPYILSDGRFKDQIPVQAPQATAVMRGKRDLVELLANIVDQHAVQKVAVQAGYLRVADRKKIAQHIGSDRVLDADDGLIQQRSVKDATEIESIRQAIAIQQQAFLRTREYIRPGMTEADIAGYLEHQSRILGADKMSFDTIVAADANAALPHYQPGLAQVCEGGMVLIDWGVQYQGYCADMTRVLAIGKMPAKIREIYDVVHQAYQAGVEAIRPGASQTAVDQAARDVVEKAGFGEHFQHTLGHGIGLDIHEQPRLSFRQDGQLLAGQVVTVEPGIYLPGIGGVRLENDVLITEDGPEVLCDLPLDPDWAVLETQERPLRAPHYNSRPVIRR